MLDSQGVVPGGGPWSRGVRKEGGFSRWRVERRAFQFEGTGRTEAQRQDRVTMPVWAVGAFARLRGTWVRRCGFVFNLWVLQPGQLWKASGRRPVGRGGWWDFGKEHFGGIFTRLCLIPSTHLCSSRGPLHSFLKVPGSVFRHGRSSRGSFARRNGKWKRGVGRWHPPLTKK